MNNESVNLSPETQATDARILFGFWIYLMTDCVLFATLFAVYAVLHGNTFGGSGSNTLFNLPFAFVETLILLTSSFLCGLGFLAAHQHKVRQVLGYFSATFILGTTFVVMEVAEFVRLIAAGNTAQRSAFLSSYFVLVGTHGLHVTVGLLWMAVLLVRIARLGLGRINLRNAMLLSFFWHFLDVIWIFIFTFVYLMGIL